MSFRRGAVFVGGSEGESLILVFRLSFFLMIEDGVSVLLWGMSSSSTLRLYASGGICCRSFAGGGHVLFLVRLCHHPSFRFPKLLPLLDFSL